MQAWKDNYPWLHQAFMEVGPRARAASNGWRTRIEEELKTTLDFKIRPDGTAAVWCGMSAYDFQHEPTTKELFEGLREAYRREFKRVGGNQPARTGGWKMSPAAPTASKPPTSVRAIPPRVKDSLTRALGAVLLPRVIQLVQLTLIFLAVTALTLVLSDVATTVR
jgi:hypothetical protein